MVTGHSQEDGAIRSDFFQLATPGPTTTSPTSSTTTRARRLATGSSSPPSWVAVWESLLEATSQTWWSPGGGFTRGSGCWGSAPSSPRHSLSSLSTLILPTPLLPSSSTTSLVSFHIVNYQPSRPTIIFNQPRKKTGLCYRNTTFGHFPI